MNKKIKELWLNALRSGEYKQCRYRLKKINNKNQESFCCLGVLTDLAIKNSKIGDWNINKNQTGVNYLNNNRLITRHITLPPDIAHWAGMHNINSTGTFLGKNGYISLSDKNDRGASFKQIANIIEKNIEGI